jgi:hypothetical protein
MATKLKYLSQFGAGWHSVRCDHVIPQQQGPRTKCYWQETWPELLEDETRWPRTLGCSQAVGASLASATNLMSKDAGRDPGVMEGWAHSCNLSKER